MGTSHPTPAMLSNWLINGLITEEEYLERIVKLRGYEKPLSNTKLEIQPSQPVASQAQVGGNHYKNLPIQPIHYSERNKLTPMEHTAIKYITRHRFKGGKQDIEKAIHTLNLILEEYYPEPKWDFQNCSARKD
jgi:hypothetical protein